MLRLETSMLAVPPAPTLLLPRTVAPSLKLTVPLGAPAAGAVTLSVAVSVTLCPNTEGLAALLKAAEVAPLLTVWVRADDVLVLKLPSPLYCAEIACSPTLRLETLRLAVPPAA